MKFLIKKSPDGFIKSVNDEISSILNRNFDSLFPEFIYDEDVCNNEKYAMPVELHEKDKEYIIKAELPGVKKENFDIDLDKNHITINAKKEEEHKEDTKGFRKSEFRYGEFSRTVYFPQDIDIEKTTAKLEHGILTIDAPKRETEKDKIKKLTIQ
ncbi:Hsp20/alpha crystallin family protein [bacterium]|nr:Hsp20/alpha crystallin family protein [bacterium]